MAWAPPLVAAAALVASACGPSTVGVGGEEPTLGAVASQVALSPAVAALGAQLTATVSGVSTTFSPDTDVDLGEGVVVTSVTVVSPHELSVGLVVSPTALPGFRSLTVRGAPGEVAAENALLLQVGAVAVAPDEADRGQTVSLTVSAQGFEMVDGYTWLDLGAGITTWDFTPHGDGTATALVEVAADAAPGPRDVSLQNGPSRVLMPGGFTVGRGLTAITLSPEEVSQGAESVGYVIEGYGTHFAAGATTVDFGVGLLLDPSDPQAMIVESPTRISGRLTVCRAAVPGDHGVAVSTVMPDGRLEKVASVDVLRILEVAPTVDEAYASFSLSYTRSLVEGRLEEAVGASGVFQVVAGACGTSNGSGCPSESAPPNMPAYYPPPGCTPTGNTVLFPPTPSIDAGPYVFLEGPGGSPSIRLDKEADSDGTFYYAPSEELPLSAWVPDAAYRVRIPGGSGEGAVPETTIERVLITPPSLFTMVSPDLSDAPTLNPYDSVSLAWVDEEGEPGAHTYPLCNLSFRMQTESALDGTATRVDVRQILPDTGALVLPSEAVSFLAPGVGRMSLTASRVGDVYALPGSRYSTYSAASVTFTGVFELRE